MFVYRTHVIIPIPDAKRDAPDTNVSDLEREIDERVYALYGLTREEIRIVEGGESRTTRKGGAHGNAIPWFPKSPHFPWFQSFRNAQVK